MAGDTVDSNSSVMAKELAQWGFDVAYKVTIGDDFELLCEEIKRLGSNYGLVLINGGLGPTVDDLTAQALATVCDVELEENPEAKAHVEHWCGERKVTLTKANLKQAFLPAGAEVVHNPIGSAPGIACRYKDSLLVATPGVPSELKAMLAGSVRALLERELPHTSGSHIRRLKLFGIGESTVQQRVEDELEDWPEQVDLGFRAGLPLLEIKLTVDDEQHLSLRDQCEEKFRELFADSLVGENDDSLAHLVYELLKSQGKKLALAESCTGGQIAAMLTTVPGVSAVFDAGIVSYANEAKSHFLGVQESTIEQYGVVSESVVVEMAQGVLREAKADYAIAVSGIAGPDGARPGKPVGTVCVAWGTHEKMQSLEFFFPLGRTYFQTLVSAVALDLIRRRLLGIEQLPDFLADGGRYAKKP